MSARTRHVVTASLLASSVVCGGMLALGPTAGAAAPTAGCTVTASPDGTSATITGEGFTAPRTLDDGQSAQPPNVDASGRYCRRTGAQPEPQDPNGSTPSRPSPGEESERGRRDGTRAGLEAAAEGCDAPPRAERNTLHGAAYWDSWTRAADRAYDQVC
ncbi:hypothetical protein ACFWUW_03450 [Streptomyces sp. NPDC058655]|uniref:hypothetical protein n=1 Tax=unclassified Streptomyces TaxID=2593676 RepID=UPI003659AABC